MHGQMNVKYKLMNFLSRDKSSKKLQIRQTLIEISVTLRTQNKTKIN